MNALPRHVCRVLACIALLSGAAAQATVLVRIGLLSPITGAQAAYGQDNLAAAQMSVRDLNRQGMQIAGQPLRFELEVMDDMADPRTGVQAAQMLVDKQVRYVLGPYNSGVVMPTARVFDDAGVLVFTVASNPQATRPLRPLLFRLGPTDEQMAERMAQYAAGVLRIRTVAVVDDHGAYGAGLAQSFIDHVTRLGVRVVAREFGSDHTTDFSPMLTSIRAARPDAVFYGGYSAQGGPMLRQMRGLGIQVPLLGGDGICSAETTLLSQLKGDPGVYCTRGGVPAEGAEAGRRFAERYRAEFQREPLSYAANFYDGAQLLGHAIQATQSTEPAQLARYIASARYVGMAALYAYDARHDLQSATVSVFRLKGRDVVPAPDR